MQRRDESSRRYLDRLDAQTALRHLDTAVHEAGRAGERAGDIARRELKHGWNTVDRKLENSTLAGSGPGGSPFAFTEVRRPLSLSPAFEVGARKLLASGEPEKVRSLSLPALAPRPRSNRLDSRSDDPPRLLAAPGL